MNHTKKIFWVTYILFWILFEAPRNTDPVIFGTIVLYYFSPLILFYHFQSLIKSLKWFKKWRILFLLFVSILLCFLKLIFEQAWWWFFANVFDYSFTVVTYEGAGLKAYSPLFKGYFIFILLNEMFSGFDIDTEKENPEEPNTLFVKTDRQFVRIITSEILLIEGLRDYVKIHTLNEVFITKRTLQSFESDLMKCKEFLRVQKSFIVNTNRISKIYGNTLVIEEKKVPIGKTYKPNVEERLGVRL